MSWLLYLGGLSPQTTPDPDVEIPQSYLDWVNASVTDRIVLCELQPAQLLTGWQATSGFSNTHEIHFSRLLTGKNEASASRSFTKNTSNSLDLGTGAIGALLNGASAVSVAGRVLPRSFGSTSSLDDVIFSNAINTNVSGAWLSVGNGFVSVRGRSQSSDSVQAVTDMTALASGSWHDVGAVLDFSGDSIRTYRNGVAGLSSTSASFGSSTYVNGSPSVADRIGPIGTLLTSRQLDGLVDYVAIWKVDIGAAGFAALKAGVNPLNIRPDGLVFYMALGRQSAADIDLKGGIRSTVVGSVPVSTATSRLEQGTAYRRLDRLRQNDVDLVSRGSISEVNNSAGSYFYDESKHVLYAHTTSSLTPNVFDAMAAYFSVFASTTVKDFVGGQLYEPKLTGTLPSVDAEAQQWFDVVNQVASGSIEFVNAGGLFDGVVSPPYIWRNKQVKLFLGGGTMPRNEYQRVGTMLIDTLAVRDQTVTMSVRALSSAMEQTLPLHTLGKGEYPYLAEGLEGTYKPLLYGRKFHLDPPLVESSKLRNPDGDPSASEDVYLISDADVQGLYSVGAVRATRTGSDPDGSGIIGEVRQLEPNVEYDVDHGLCTVRVLGYSSERWSIRVDAIGKPGGQRGYLSTFGEIARDMLVAAGEDVANIDTFSFAEADTVAPFELGLYVREPAQASAAVGMLQQSVLGAVFTGSDGRWRAKVVDPLNTDTQGSLEDADFVSWQESDRVKPVYPITRLYYDQKPATWEWSLTTASDSAAEYAYGTRDGLNIYTALVDSSDAELMAQRYRVMATHPETWIDAEMRGMGMMTAEMFDHVTVSRARAPEPGGAYAEKRMQVLGIQKSLSPTSVRAKLGDIAGLQGFYGRIKKVAPSPAVTWANATTEQRSKYVFVANSSGEVGGSTDNAHKNW